MCIFYNLMHTIYLHARLSFNVARQGENCTANDRDFLQASLRIVFRSFCAIKTLRIRNGLGVM